MFVAICAAGAGAAYIATRPIARNFGVVAEGRLYRSGRLTPESLERIAKQTHIKTVVDLGGNRPGAPEEAAEQDAAARLGLRRVVLRLEGDGTGDPNMYVEALRILGDAANQPALVHCAAGAQRTGAATILYRHCVEGKTITEAYPEAAEYGHKPGKDWKMLAYLADWGAPIEKAWREGGRVEGWPRSAAQAEPARR